jgi:hypothetical protein
MEEWYHIKLLENVLAKTLLRKDFAIFFSKERD